MKLFKKKKEKKVEQDTEKIEKGFKKTRKKVKKSLFRRKSRILFFLDRAGIQIETTKLNKTIFHVCIGLSLVLTFYILHHFSFRAEYKLSFLFILVALISFVFIFGCHQSMLLDQVSRP